MFHQRNWKRSENSQQDVNVDMGNSTRLRK